MTPSRMSVCLLFFVFSAVYGGELTVSHSPSTLRFGHADALRTSDLDDVLAASLGYTPVQTSLWPGLTITSPFSSPTAAVLVEVHSGGASVRQEGTTYGLKEDVSIDEVFNHIKNVYGSRAQRHTLFKHLTVDTSPNDSWIHTIPKTQVLDYSQEPDASFLREMAALVTTARTAEEITTIPHGGQDVIFLEVSGMEQLVRKYGADSPQVEEASSVLRAQLSKVTELMREVYSDRVVVMSATVEEAKQLSRRARSILQVAETDDPNVNKSYSSDYPAIFNIILWLSIVLVLAILAISMSMWNMDPGRDSIIYRMTTMRMKKDN
ncbi:renin receptor-like [Scylla paramamosain]|uniref:renin receptor-like n=1 Tax=Scylla paramamosain TaxID=85552 RepID=UPI003082D626